MMNPPNRWRTSGSIVKRWIYQDQLTPAAEVDSVGNVVTRFAPGYLVRGDSTYALITDHLGSIRLVVNVATSAIRQKIEYDEYGNITYMQNKNEFTDFAYAGGMYDKDTKLTRFGARDYDATTGRWTAKDPILFVGGTSNLYEYCLNNPVNGIDLSGNQVIITIKYNNGIYGGRTWVWHPDNGWRVFPSGPRGDNGVEIQPGMYEYIVYRHKMSDPNGYKALNLYTLNGSRTLPADRTDGKGNTADGINVHKGNSTSTANKKQRTGSKGCHTIPYENWDDFINEFSSGEKGIYIYVRNGGFPW